ncbi:hypothetical protein [Pendulispora albinea]|uniref:Uncharacterized protein n=1 Tax=Pendulispora albinea TaxID=2741071 RepID=A0ABZ2M5Z7_9BACT
MHYALAASQPKIVDAVMSLAPKGNAVDLVVAAVFAAAALSPSTLLGPVQILMGGGGAGLRAIDGRTRQPGMGAPRPRGFLPRDVIPEAAYVGVPALPAALAAAHALAGELSFARVVGPAVALAKDESDARREVLARVSRRGALALGEGDLGEDLVSTAGRLGGGLLTHEDFANARPTETECQLETCGPRAIGRAPWLDDGAPAPTFATEVHVVAAADVRGRIAIACYNVTAEGLDLPAWGLLAPRTAAPVRRGEPRIRPGEPRPAPAPCVLLSADGVLGGAIGFVGPRGAVSLTSAVESFFSGMPIESLSPEGTRPTGVLRTPSSARAL